MIPSPKFWKLAFVAFFLSTIGDYFWHMVLFGEFYRVHLEAVNSGVPVSMSFSPFLLGLEVLMALASTHFVLGMSKSSKEAAGNGALLGLVATGAVNAVNHSFIVAWDLPLALIDTVFGILIGAIVGWCIFSLSKKN